MKVSWRSILRRLTGFSVPFFGLQWNVPEGEEEIARDLLIELEDRRVLYNPYELESVGPVIGSVQMIRRSLTDTLKRVEGGTNEFVISVRDMRRACRRFLEAVEKIATEGRDYTFYGNLGFVDQVTLGTALGELRAVFGLHLAKIAVMYGLDVEEELASIMPLAEDDELVELPKPNWF